MPREQLGRSGRDARKLFDHAVVPFLEDQGVKRVGQLDVVSTLVGEPMASTLDFVTAQSTEVLKRLETHPDWTKVARHESRGWKSVETFRTTVTDDVTLSFDPDKIYTLAIAWTDPAHPGDYDAYLDAVETDFDRVGARFLQSFRNITHVSTRGKSPVSPYQLTLVEWDSADSINNLLGGQTYAKARTLFDRGVSDFRLYQLRASR